MLCEILTLFDFFILLDVDHYILCSILAGLDFNLIMMTMNHVTFCDSLTNFEFVSIVVIINYFILCGFIYFLFVHLTLFKMNYKLFSHSRYQ